MKKRSILDVANGEIVDSLSNELERVMININDVNTDTKPRTITLKITLKPSDDKKIISVSSLASSSVRPNKKVETMMSNIKEQNQDGNVEFKLQEILVDCAPGQINIDGDIAEAPQPIVIGNYSPNGKDSTMD